MLQFIQMTILILSIYLQQPLLAEYYLAPVDSQTGLNCSGDVLTVWSVYDTIHETHIIQSSFMTLAVGEWSSPPTTISDPNQVSFTPQLAVNSIGDAIATWITLRKDSKVNSLQGAIYHKGVWSSIKDLTAPGESLISSTVKINDAGNINITWIACPVGSNNTVLYSVSATVDGSWGPIQQVSF